MSIFSIGETVKVNEKYLNRNRESNIVGTISTVKRPVKRGDIGTHVYAIELNYDNGTKLFWEWELDKISEKQHDKVDEISNQLDILTFEMNFE